MKLETLRDLYIYGTLRTYAQQLNLEEDSELFQETLEEEKEADQKLSQLATECINAEAEEGEGEGGEAEENEEPAKRAGNRSMSRRG